MASRGLNKVMLIGNLGADPEMRYTPNGKAVTTFRIAVSRTWRDASGNQQEDTQWFRIVTWETLAEICNRYLTKGRSVYVEGRLQTRSWEGQDGIRRYMTEVVAQEMIMLDTRQETRDETEAPFPELEPEFDVGLEEDDLPF
ncbi:MAG: single-stranded DNA-binding protein [Chloroflexia bacterium]|nr:single-stranded DNA-binding protein [Chloroflexia bacterium]